MSNCSRVFHIEEIRRLIFRCKWRERWGELLEARDMVIARNNRRKYPLKYHEDQMHMTNPYNWRETAALLGMYWAFYKQPFPGN